MMNKKDGKIFFNESERFIISECINAENGDGKIRRVNIIDQLGKGSADKNIKNLQNSKLVQVKKGIISLIPNNLSITKKILKDTDERDKKIEKRHKRQRGWFSEWDSSIFLIILGVVIVSSFSIGFLSVIDIKSLSISNNYIPNLNKEEVLNEGIFGHLSGIIREDKEKVYLAETGYYNQTTCERIENGTHIFYAPPCNRNQETTTILE